MNHKGIGDAARNARKQQNLTQKDAAKKCGISHRQYSSVERGEESTSITTFNKIANGLKITFSLGFPTAILIFIVNRIVHYFCG